MAVDRHDLRLERRRSSSFSEVKQSAYGKPCFNNQLYEDRSTKECLDRHSSMSMYLMTSSRRINPISTSAGANFPNMAIPNAIPKRMSIDGAAPRRDSLDVVIQEQPTSVPASKSREPVPVVCPSCKNHVVSVAQFHKGCGVWVSFFVFFICCFP